MRHPYFFMCHLDGVRSGISVSEFTLSKRTYNLSSSPYNRLYSLITENNTTKLPKRASHRGSNQTPKTNPKKPENQASSNNNILFFFKKSIMRFLKHSLHHHNQVHLLLH